MTALHHTPQEIQKMTMKEFLNEGNYAIDTVKSRAENGKSPHFFDADTMRFFSSRISEKTWELKDSDEIYFITSEADNSRIKHAGSVRQYTVRSCGKDGNIEKVSEFQEFPTIREAQKFLKEYLANGEQARESKN